MDDEGLKSTGQIKEEKLIDVARKVNEISWKLDTQVFGERPQKEPAQPGAGDNILQIRGILNEALQRLNGVSQVLDRIGV